jgi:Flp pilus assembly pilin Flp
MGSLRALQSRLAVEAGQTLAEYGIMVSVIAIIVIVAAIVFGGDLSGLFKQSATSI